MCRVYNNINYIGRGISDTNTVLTVNILRKILNFGLGLSVLLIEDNAKC